MDEILKQEIEKFIGKADELKAKLQNEDEIVKIKAELEDNLHENCEKVDGAYTEEDIRETVQDGLKDTVDQVFEI